MYIEDPIEMRETSKGYRIQLCYSSHTYEIYDLLEEYVNFCFIDRDIKHVNTINYWEDELYVALGNDAKNLGYDEEDTKTLEEEAKSINDKYWIFPINIFEHSDYNFTIWYRHWRDDRFWWALLIDKEKRKEYRIEQEPTDEDLKNIMKTFTALYNWRVYEINILQKDIYTNKKWDELEQREYVDWISWIIDNREEEYEDNYSKEYWEIIKI